MTAFRMQPQMLAGGIVLGRLAYRRCEFGSSGVRPMAAAAAVVDLNSLDEEEKRFNVLVNVIRACGLHPKLTEPLVRIASTHEQRPWRCIASLHEQRDT